MKFRSYGIFFAIFLLLISYTGIAAACGGLFCQTVPVNQQSERIIFAVNDNGTIDAYVQINYTGDAPSFSWVVPVPSVPELDVVEMASFDELDMLTQPVFIAPPVPACAAIPVPSMSMVDGAGAVEESEVIVLASGTAGPYQYDVVDSPDPDALIVWLRDNEYQITQEMEPLVHVYNEEGMIFLAMKLQPERGVQDIQPIKMTYESTNPMIPIRLTAVAANPNMNILTWIFADEQAYPANYEHIEIADEELSGEFFSFSGGTNYMTLLDARIDEHQGLAMITEYAQPASELAQVVTDPLLVQLSQDYRYVTRFLGRMSPEEMTLDPVFNFDGQREHVSNIHDLSNRPAEIFWNCPKEENRLPLEGGVVAMGGVFGLGLVAWQWRKNAKAKVKN